MKLKVIRYNKILQKINNISLLNYKVFRSSYIVYESKTKGKELNGYNVQLIYEGEYLNGKRNGKGKEYDTVLIYDGEYLNGKKNGKGKKNNDGYLIYEGVYLNGKRNGKGK